jgi:ABC-type dipeptide/oligopeptide/nickel transport system permease component
MRRFIVVRSVSAVLTIWLALSAVFFWIEHVGTRLSAQHPEVTNMVKAWAARLGVHEPGVTHRYFRWFGQVFSGDLGDSFRAREPVTQVVGQAVGPSFRMLLAALAVTAVLTLYGYLIFTRLSRWSGVVYMAVVAALGGLSGLLLVLVTRNKFGTLAWRAFSFQWERPVIRPAVCIGLIVGAYLVVRLWFTARGERRRRSAEAEAARREGREAARPPRPLWRRVWARTLALPWWLQVVLVAAVVVLVRFVEPPFDWHGVGWQYWLAVSEFDYPTQWGMLAIVALGVPLAALALDLVAVALDPDVGRIGRGWRWVLRRVWGETGAKRSLRFEGQTEEPGAGPLPEPSSSGAAPREASDEARPSEAPPMMPPPEPPHDA